MNDPQILKAINECFRLQFNLGPNDDSTTTADRTALDDQLARLHTWARVISAFAPGHASLKYRLRDSAEVGRLIIQLLELLQRLLTRGTGIGATGLQEIDLQLHAIENSIEAGPSDTYESPQLSYVSWQHSFSKPIVETEILPSENRLAQIEQTIDHLYRLLVATRRPSMGTQTIRSTSFHMNDGEGNEYGEAFKGYVMKVLAHWFSNAAEPLRERLAMTTTLRRKRLMSWREQQQDSRFKCFENEGIHPSMAMVQRDISPSHTPASLFSKSSTVQEGSASGVSTAQFAASNYATNLQVPPPPKVDSESLDFECPYCYFEISIVESKPTQWKKHILRDLGPYVCLAIDCLEPRTLFHDLHTWVHHMQREHSRQWGCTAPGHTDFTFDSENALAEHMRASHKGAFNGKENPTPFKGAGRPIPVFTSCPLCGFAPAQGAEGSNSLQNNATSLRKLPSVGSADQLWEHIANHLEQLSLISLPWPDGVDEGTQSEVTASHHADKDSGSNCSSHDGIPSLSFDADTEQTAGVPSSDIGLSTLAITDDKVNGIAKDEWRFIPRFLYYGYDRDPSLQTFLRRVYIESSPSVNGKQGPILPCHFVSFSSDKEFLGRELVVAAIEDALLPSSMSASSSVPGAKGDSNPRTFALYGLGGMGKTQVAIEFVTRHRDKFDAIFWVHANNASKLAHDFNNIALKLGLVAKGSADSKNHTYTREVVKRWLVEPRKNLRGRDSELASWLLIFDGVEVPTTLNEFWPYGGPGSVLITSRNPFGWSISWPLVPFTTFEASAFMHQLFFEFGKETMGNQPEVTKVSRMLGGLPLALTQMAGVMTNRGVSAREFYLRYHDRESRQQLLQAKSDPGLQGPRYEHSLASVWALEKLTRGATLLNTLAMFDHTGITERLFGENIGKINLPGFPSSPEDYQLAKDELHQSSLLTQSRSGKKLFVHRVVQDVADTRLSEGQFQSTIMACVQMVSNLWPFETFTWRHGTARWKVCEELSPHVLKLKERLEGHTVPSEDDLTGDYKFARLLTDAGWYHHERGRSFEPEYLYYTAHTICETWVARISTHPATSSQRQQYLGKLNAILAEIAHNRGCHDLETNDPLNALVRLKYFNELMEQEFAADPSLQRRDMRLAISWNELGNAHMFNKQYARGGECFQRSIQTMRRLDSFHETDLSLPIVNLGLSYWLQGNPDAALEQLRAGLRKRERALGPDDRESFITGRFLHALGNVMSTLGRREESVVFHRKALQHYESTLGGTHHRTADVCVKMAEHSIQSKQGNTAMALLDHAFKVYETRNTYLPEKARVLFMRSQVLKMMRQEDKAEVVRKKAVELYYEVRKGEKLKKSEELADDDFCELIPFWSR